MSKFFSSRYIRAITRLFNIPQQLTDLQDYLLQEHTRKWQANHPNPLNRQGNKCFSQSDEDGITLEILRRMELLTKGVYVEFGVGCGRENNTLILAALGWKGFWVGGESIRYTVDNSNEKFRFYQRWITKDNITSLLDEGLKEIGERQIDVASIDLDGNDYYCVHELLHYGMRPKLFIVEYNAKFPPPIKFKIAYDPAHTWKSDDYFGASLASFDELFSQFNYRLVCCNAHTGCNAFYIQNEYASQFADVPEDIRSLYAEPRYHLYHRYGHKKSDRTVARVLGVEL